VAALVVATTLGATGAGTFALVRILPHMGASVLGLGLTIANPFLVGSGRYPVRAITQNTVALGLMLSGLGWTAWLLLSGLLQARFYPELSAGAVLWVGVALPLVLLRNYLNSIQQGLQSFKGANVVLAAEDITTMLVMLLLLTDRGRESGMTVVVAAAIAGAGVSCLAAIIALALQGIWPWPVLHREIAAYAIPFGLKGHVGRMANVLNWRLDTVILSALTNTEIVGYYAVANQVAELFRPLSQSITFVLRPLIAGLSSAEARLRGLVLFRRVFVLNLAMIAVMGLAGGHAIVKFFGEEFAVAVPAFYILLIGLAAHGANGVLAGYNVGIGRPEFNTYTALAGLAVTIALDVLLIPSYGIVGAAIASSVAYSTKAVTLVATFLITAGITLPQLVGVKEYTPDAA
jgi:O-antigen/teichoic acid export membrane protein